jgi:hypothetical protein
VYDWYELIEWGDILSIVALEKKEKTIQKPYTNIYTKKIQLRIQTLSQVPTQNIDTTKLAPITTTTQAKQLQAKAQQDHYTYLLHRQRNTPKQFQTYYHGVNHWLVHSNAISTLHVTVNRISIMLEHVFTMRMEDLWNFHETLWRKIWDIWSWSYWLIRITEVVE